MLTLLNDLAVFNHTFHNSKGIINCTFQVVHHMLGPAAKND